MLFMLEIDEEYGLGTGNAIENAMEWLQTDSEPARADGDAAGEAIGEADQQEAIRRGWGFRKAVRTRLAGGKMNIFIFMNFGKTIVILTHSDRKITS